MELFQLVLDLTGMGFYQNSGEELKLRLTFPWLDRPVRVDQIAVYTAENYPLEISEVLHPINATLGFHGVLEDQWDYANHLISTINYTNIIPGAGMPEVVSGNFTAYGDVLPLLLTDNDEFVIMGRGDEIQLQFLAPTNLPSSPNTTTVILHSAVYYKAIGKSLGSSPNPIPFNSMPFFPYNSSFSYDLTAHGNYLATYNTRSYTATYSHFTLWTDLFTFTTTEFCSVPLERRKRYQRDL